MWVAKTSHQFCWSIFLIRWNGTQTIKMIYWKMQSWNSLEPCERCREIEYSDRLRRKAKHALGETAMLLKWLDPYRLRILSPIMVVSWDVACQEAGCEIIMGVEGDPAMPHGMQRPKGTVLKSWCTDQGAQMIDVQLDNGVRRSLVSSSISPLDVFEITRSFVEKLLEKYPHGAPWALSRLGDPLH